MRKMNTVFKPDAHTCEHCVQSQNEHSKTDLQAPLPANKKAGRGQQNQGIWQHEYSHSDFDTLYDLGRAHRSHRWGHRFESCCDHHTPSKLACQVFFLPCRHTRKDVNLMAKFVSHEKLSKRARKELDNQKRTVWAFSPTTMKVESKKTLQPQEKRSCLEG